MKNVLSSFPVDIHPKVHPIGEGCISGMSLVSAFQVVLLREKKGRRSANADHFQPSEYIGCKEGDGWNILTLFPLG